MHRALSALNMSRTLGGSEKFTLSFMVEVTAAFIPSLPSLPLRNSSKIDTGEMGPRDRRQDEQEQALLSSLARKGREDKRGEFCTAQVGESACLLLPHL